MKKLLICVFVLTVYVEGYCLEKTKLITVNISTLDTITESYKKQRNIFDDSDYSSFVLYRAIILNDFIRNEFSKSELNKYFCQTDDDDLLQLLKWKVTMTYTSKKLIESGINCDKTINKSKQLMETYFLDSLYVDAFVEYYKIIKNDSSFDLYEKWSFLNSNLYKTPDIEIAEYIIDVQHEIYKKTGKIFGLWNVSVIAAKYGSDKGFLNLINILKDIGDNDYKFLSKIRLLASS